VQLTVKYADGREETVKTTPRDIIEFERRYGTSYAAALANPNTPGREEHWYWFAWSPLHRCGKDTREFEAFIDAIESVQLVMEEEPKDPFPPAPTEGSSPPSPPGE
jgi:hypothetical protein